MIIENSLNPNCSEAVMRIRTDKLTKDEEDMLFRLLDGVVQNYEGPETYINQGEVFGIRVITINGDMPYNRPEELENITRGYNVEIEFDGDL